MLKIVVNIAKKIPMPGVEFSSIQASCSIEGEASNVQDAAAEAAKLYYQAERAVDSQLRFTTEQRKESGGSQSQTRTGISSNDMVRTNNNGGTVQRQNSRPYQNNGRTQAPVTDGQLRYLDRLITETNTDINAVLNHFHVASLRDLSCKVAAGLIDELKSRGVANR